MNTFLPSPDFDICAKSLDPDRLNRQISEVSTIARTLWVYQLIMEGNQRQLPWGVVFPSVIKLWVTEGGLVLLPELRRYHMAMHREWRNHGKGPHKSYTQLNWDALTDTNKAVRDVMWPAIVHESHRSKLFSKDAGFYRRVFDRLELPKPILSLPYAWENPTVRVPCNSPS